MRVEENTKVKICMESKNIDVSKYPHSIPNDRLTAIGNKSLKRSEIEFADKDYKKQMKVYK